MSEAPESHTALQRFTSVEIDVLWTALAHAHDSIIVYEPPLSGGRPRIVYVNEATVSQSGFSREELIAGSTGTGPLTDRETVRALREAMLRGEPLRVRLALYRKDGSSYWGEIDGRPVRDAHGSVTHWISIERDISDAVERERSLAALLDASRTLFGVLDRPALDAAFLRALGSTLSARAAFADDFSDPLVMRALRGDAAVSDQQGRFAVALRAAGRDAHVVVVARDGDGAPTANDLTVLALLAQTYTSAARNAALFDEVHQQRAAVLELSRMKGDLVTMLAHDLNNPLTTIRGFAELLAEQHRQDPDGAAATEAIIRATERLVDLGRETLALARLEDNALVLTRSPIDYGALLTELARQFAPAVEIAVDGDVGGTGDPVLIRGLFEHVIANAVKHAAPAATIAVRLHAYETTIVVEVDDPGTGTAAADAVNTGTGFAEYFVRLVVQRHGGTISVDSTGEGTSVVVALPRDPPVAVPPGVLVLERGVLSDSYTEQVLRDAGYRVRIVHDLDAFADALATDTTAVAIVPEGAQDAIASAGAVNVRVLELRKPYLARDLLRAIDSLH